MKKQERKNRVVARGEISNHAHVVIGNAVVNGDTIKVLGRATIRHILESSWVNEGVEVWTKEHADIPLEKGVYKYIPQIEYDPYKDQIRKVVD